MGPGLAFLRALGLLDWPTLAAGFRRGEVSQVVVEEVATLEVVAGDGPSAELIALTATDLSDLEVQELLDQLATGEGADEAVALRRLLLARLLDLDAERSATGLANEQVVDRLELLYAEFDYPEVLRACSRYDVEPSGREERLAADSSGWPMSGLHAAIDALSAEVVAR